ncbi:VQ motif-containing protein 20-like [Salvia divinorum]|uniref:VQ motif-containing protein 20-like n=1 Tax=Salvia divinorum TaxID=28513 RepID=A0ABD1HAW4_SALDI
MKKCMSPTLKHNDSDVTRRVSNSMRISKDSHVIQKTPSNQNPPPTPPKRQPVIIYTHSPKVIHAVPSNFMKLVQRLTGLSDDGEVEPVAKVEVETPKEDDEKGDTSSGSFGNIIGGGSYEENYETASPVDDRIFVNHDPAAYRMPYLEDAAPQLTAAAGSCDFYCSPQTSSIFQSPMAMSTISPFMNHMKPFADY